jgi:hypothetical protein
MRLNPTERRIYVRNVHYRQHPLNELIFKTGGRPPCATCMWLAANVHSLKVRDLRREPSMAPRAKSRVVLPSDTVGSATASPSARRAPSPRWQVANQLTGVFHELGSYRR